MSLRLQVSRVTQLEKYSQWVSEWVTRSPIELKIYDTLPLKRASLDWSVIASHCKPCLFDCMWLDARYIWLGSDWRPLQARVCQAVTEIPFRSLHPAAALISRVRGRVDVQVSVANWSRTVDRAATRLLRPHKLHQSKRISDCSQFSTTASTRVDGIKWQVLSNSTAVWWVEWKRGLKMFS